MPNVILFTRQIDQPPAQHFKGLAGPLIAFFKVNKGNMGDKSNQHGCNKGNDMRGMDFRDIEQCFLKRSGSFFFLAPNITFSMMAQDMANENNTQYFILNEQLQYY